MNIKLISFTLLILSVFFACNQENSKEKKNKSAKISSVPEWSKNAIWYQIFVERFRNGDLSNDPTREDIRNTYPDSIPGNWTITPWGQDWYQPDDYFENSNLDRKWDNLQLRRYGGDLQGVIDELDYLESLGINAIYFNPLNDAPSLHKYDPRHWRHIDRNFGPDPKKDIKITASENPIDPATWKWTTADSLFLKLIKKCHEKGIRVVLDYSFNHTGKDFWAFKDVKAKGKASEVADWYEIEEFDNPETPENEFKYKGWAGVSTLPELKKDIIGDNKTMPFEGNLHSQKAKNHIFAVAKRWLDPNKDGKFDDGVDGYRLDVAAEVPMGFWVDFRKVVRKVNPETYLIGEIWWLTWPDSLMLPHNFLKGDMFDAIMNYRWYRPARHFFADAPDPMKPSVFVAELEDKFKGIDKDRQKAMMNLLASHDAPRVSTSLYNNGLYKYMVKPYDNANYKIDKPDAKTRTIQKMLLIHQFTFIGAPHIWYGDEVGMWGADDPDTRKPMVWSDIVYADETTHPFGKERKTDKVEQDTELLDFYKKLIQIRKTNPILVDGDLTFSLVDDENNTLAYNRSNDKAEIVVAFNKSNEPKVLKIPVTKDGNYKDLLNEKSIQSEQGKLKIELEGMKAVILKNYK
jgi:cyclomaltodextrinase / maltogenic alpha-amylase / neopullulanase